VASQIDIGQELAGVTLFADLSPAQLDNVGQAFEEQWFQPGEAEWRVDGQLADRTATTLLSTKPMTLKRGDWFGELSILFDEPSISDVVAVTPLHCIVLPSQDLEAFLFRYPQVMFRLLLGEARRLRDPLRWR
jgi:CRP-like cAMP-binding protein